MSQGLAGAFQAAAETAGAEVCRTNLADMDFDPDLTDGYHSRKTLEPCLEDWRENIMWANHLVWADPKWWDRLLAARCSLLAARCSLGARPISS
ncbi:NAD(P)H-dependent oxidoreductase [Henriciella litoralis]|uniref:NAD(P)H-dependent oxidoreductase n=1 Tax=Henriciella litoralis TaxID=568102 RepID=UPI00111C6707|nr:NAD(P)H-dependent oxidoreductase [Henriciella litoralis]